MATIRVTRDDGRGVVDEISWQAEHLEIAEKPNGPAAAALIAAGVGSLALGILTVLNEASQDINEFLNLENGVGPLSGKTTFAVVVYLAVWALLSRLMWKQRFSWTPVLWVTALLVAGGFLGTFPEFFKLFAAD